MQGIYNIYNKLTEKRYVGSAKNIDKRMYKQHRYLLRTGSHWNPHLQNAWNKDGEPSFIFGVLEEVADEFKLIEREQYWMDFYRSYERSHGYNLAPRADRSVVSDETKAKMRENGIRRGAPLPAGWNHTEESKAKISEAGKRRKGIKLSPETRIKIGNIWRGKSWVDRYGESKALEMKINLSNRQQGNSNSLGKKASAETKLKKSISMKGKPQTKEKREKCSAAKLGTLNPMYK